MMHSPENKSFIFVFSQFPVRSLLSGEWLRNVLWSSNINTSYLSGRDWGEYSRLEGKMIIPSLHMYTFSGIKLCLFPGIDFTWKQKAALMWQTSLNINRMSNNKTKKVLGNFNAELRCFVILLPFSCWQYAGKSCLNFPGAGFTVTSPGCGEDGTSRWMQLKTGLNSRIFFTWSLEETQLKLKEPPMEGGIILTRDFFPFKNALEQIAFGKVMPQQTPTVFAESLLVRPTTTNTSALSGSFCQQCLHKLFFVRKRKKELTLCSCSLLTCRLLIQVNYSGATLH